jgi:hypothetical protein
MADNNFNELLIHNLKQIAIRLDRLDAKVDEKADKKDLINLEAKLDEKADKEDLKIIEQRLGSVGSRLDRLESEIGTFKWMLGIGLASLGVLIAVLKMF